MWIEAFVLPLVGTVPCLWNTRYDNGSTCLGLLVVRRWCTWVAGDGPFTCGGRYWYVYHSVQQSHRPSRSPRRPNWIRPTNVRLHLSYQNGFSYEDFLIFFCLDNSPELTSFDNRIRFAMMSRILISLFRFSESQIGRSRRIVLVSVVQFPFPSPAFWNRNPANMSATGLTSIRGDQLVLLTVMKPWRDTS